MNMQLIYKILKHFAIWIIYLLLPIIILPLPNLNYLGKSQFALFNYFFSSLYTVIFFYVNLFWAIPRLAYESKKWLYLLVFLFLVLLYFIIYRFFLNEINFEIVRDISFLYFIALVKLLFISIVAWAIFLYERNKEYMIAKNQAELSYLKAQVNPHFLFNALNSIYALAIKKSDKIVDAISQISDMMRYNIEESQKRFVTLSQELDYIKDYIDTQKLRLSTKTKIIYNVEGEFSGKQIEPLLLIAFIENAFKYGVSTEKESKIIIKIKFFGNNLKLHIQNDKVKKFTKTSGTGITNTIKRLNHTYYNRYTIDISDEDDYYSVQLSIKL